MLVVVEVKFMFLVLELFSKLLARFKVLLILTLMKMLHTRLID